MTSGGVGGTAMAVVGTQFCMADPVDLTVPRTTFGGLFGRNELDVTDANGDIAFKVLNELRFFGGSLRVLTDVARNPIVTLKQKVFSYSDRWEVFKGYSTYQNDLIFSVKRRHSIFSMSNKLYVFLAANTNEQVCDFRIEGDLYRKSSIIFFGESNIIIAQVSKKKLSENSWFSKKVLRVMVNANVDCAFILALVVAIKEIYEARQQASSGAAAGASSGAAAASC